MNVRSTPDLIFSKIMFVFLHLLLVSFEILDHQILSGELIVIGEVVNDLMVG